MREQRLNISETLAQLPAPWPISLLATIRAKRKDIGKKLVVLDDDPTGSQTVHGVPIITEWSVDILVAELKVSDCFYVLTNSRSLADKEAYQLSLEIGKNLRAAADIAGVEIVVDSRSDSTLRGHYPIEVNAVISGLEWELDGTIMVPFFLAGGRFTLNDIHYVQQGEALVPAAQTEFAKDKAFPFTHSHLPSYIEEKTSGSVKAKDVICISLDILRKEGPDKVTHILMAAPKGAIIVVNACADRDMEVFTLGMLQAESKGKQYLYRTAASFVRVCAGITDKPLLEATELAVETSHGGLMIVGSHIAKSTEQLNYILALPNVETIEINVPDLLEEGSRQETINKVLNAITAQLRVGNNVVLYTSRKLQSGNSQVRSLEISRTVSKSICAIVKALPEQPKFLIAKGGITSSDVATQGLGLKRAMIIGQLQAGVPVWELGPESKFPGMRYVVYPGNVGPPNGLATALKSLSI